MKTLDIYHALWRHKLFIVVMTATLVAAVAFLTVRQQPTYEASTLVRLDQGTFSSDPGETLRALEAGQQLVRTYAVIAETRSIAEEVEDELEGRVTGPELASITAEADEEVDLLLISVRSTSPERAAAIANAVPQALKQYIVEHRQVPRAAIQATTDPDAPPLPTDPVYREQLDVVDPARIPEEPAAPNLKLNLLVAGLLGLIFNGALALLIALLGDRWRDPEELERLTGRPILATVPNLAFASPPRSPDGARRALREKEQVSHVRG